MASAGQASRNRGLNVRAPVQAGKYYPAEPEFLARVIDGYLRDGAENFGKEIVKAVIAPHSGLLHSGSVAGRAFGPWKACPEEKVSRVILLAASHHFSFPGIALPDSMQFETPLGELECDAAIAERLLRHGYVRVFEAAHTPEHAIEVLLPFIQRVFGTPRIVPLIAGRADAAQIASVLNEFWGGDETRIVISSNLSRHQDYETAQKMDQNTARAIQSFDISKLTADQACGFQCIRGFLRCAIRREMRARVADLRNSGDTAGETEDISGFGAFHFFER